MDLLSVHAIVMDQIDEQQRFLEESPNISSEKETCTVVSEPTEKEVGLDGGILREAANDETVSEEVPADGAIGGGTSELEVSPAPGSDEGTKLVDIILAGMPVAKSIKEGASELPSSLVLESGGEARLLHNGSLSSQFLEDRGLVVVEGEDSGSDDETDDVEATVMEDSESTDSSSEEEDDEEEVSAKVVSEMKDRILGRDMLKEADEGSDDEDTLEGPPRTINELAVLPPVPQIDAILEPHHERHSVGTIFSVLDQQVIVEGSQHQQVLNEGSILWLTEQRVPLGLVDEVFGPVKKPYYVVRYNEASDVPKDAVKGADVGYVPEFCSFVLNQAELRKKGYDASGQHDEEISEAEFEFSDDEKEEEAKRLRKAAKRVSQVQVNNSVNGGRRGGRGGRAGVQERRGGRGRGGHGRGRDISSEGHFVSEVVDTAVMGAAGMGLRRSNPQGAPPYHADKAPGRQFQPPPDTQNFHNNAPHPAGNPHAYEATTPQMGYSVRPSLPYPRPPHEFIPGVGPLQQHATSQRPPPYQWGPSNVTPVHHGQGPQLYQGFPTPYVGSDGWHPHLPAGHETAVHVRTSGGGFQASGQPSPVPQHAEHIYQTGVGLGQPTTFAHPLVNMYASTSLGVPQSMGTGVFIPPPQYSSNVQVNPLQAPGFPGLEGRGPMGQQWPANSQGIVSGIPCYVSPEGFISQQGTIVNQVVAPHLGPSGNTVFWNNNSGR